MAIKFGLDAELRADQGKGASRRLRHAERIPAIIYGAGKDAEMITLDHKKVLLALEHEAFYSHILTLNVNGSAQQAILKDVQRHPYKPKVLHMDFLRVSATEKLHTKVKIHFINEATSVGVKAGGMAHHDQSELEILCLPKDLPEFIAVDVANVVIGQILHMSQLTLPAGVTLVAMQHGDDRAVFSIHAPRGGVEEVAPVAAAAPAAAPAAAAKPAAKK